MKSQKVFNKNLIFLIALFSLYVFGIIISGVKGQFIPMISSIILTLVWVYEIATSPMYTVFTEKELVIVYAVGYKETIAWDEIKKIYIECGVCSRVPDYVVDYKGEKEKPFFAKGKVPKSKKMQNLMDLYWKKEILW